MKRIISLILTFLFLIVTTSNVSAKENNLKSCPLSNNPIPSKNETILLKDNSVEHIKRGAATMVSVDKTFSVRLQNPSGECTSSASVKITGYYTYDKTSGTVLSQEITAQFVNIPLHWSVYLNKQWTNVSGDKITYSIYYQSYTDYLDCMHSGYWSNGATFIIK